MSAVAGRGTEVVAIGALVGKGPAIWYSPNGILWTRALGVPLRQNVYLNDVAAGVAGYVAVGEARGQAAAWKSGDGQTWTAADVPGADQVKLKRVSPWRSGFVALGESLAYSSEPQGPSVWISGDGREWTQVSSNAVDGRASSIIATSNGLVIVGEGRFHDAMLGYDTWRGVAWSSGDGVSWTSFAVTSGEGTLIDAALAGDVLVAVGGEIADDGAYRSSAWFSHDGMNWQPTGTMPGKGDDVYLTAVAAGGRGAIAIAGLGSATVGVWTSADGQQWTRLAIAASQESDLWFYSAPADVMAGGPGIVIVGDFPVFDLDYLTRWSAAVWTNPAPPDFGPTLSPTRPPCPATNEPALIEILELPPVRRASCFEDRRLSFVAVAQWGDVGGLTVATVRDGLGMGVELDPRVPESSVRPDHWYDFTGHFDRQQFVVTAIRPTTSPY